MSDESRRTAISSTIAHLAARWGRADKTILRAVFPLLAEGKPVPVERITEAAGAAPSRVESALELGRAERDAKGRVVELSGLMLSPTMHRVEIGDIALFSCCALLAQLVPLLMGRPVRVESVDPVSRRLVMLDIAPEGVIAVEPQEAVGSFIVTEPGGVAHDVGSNFCRHVHHFASPDSAIAFTADDRRRYTLEIDRLHEAARMLYRAAWVS
jgi:alkylmercury lyase